MKELGFEYLAEALPTPTHYPGRFAPRKSRVRPLPAAKAFLDQLTLQTGPWISRHALTRPRPRPRGRRRFRHNLVLCQDPGAQSDSIPEVFSEPRCDWVAVKRLHLSLVAP